MVRMKWDCRLSTGLPPAADSVGCEARRRTCREREPGTEKLCEIKWDYHIVSSDSFWDEALRRGDCNNDQSRRGHQCSETTLTGEFRFHISTPQGIWTWVPCDGKQTGSPRDQWDIVRMKWDCRLLTVYSFITCVRVIACSPLAVKSVELEFFQFLPTSPPPLCSAITKLNRLFMYSIYYGKIWLNGKCWYLHANLIKPDRVSDKWSGGVLSGYAQHMACLPYINHSTAHY